MSQVEVVALWAGLIASVAGIVLSVAALVFGVWVNNRATEVNDQTIKSLQKIESAVERLSDDTRSLIKAGWDKMLSNVGAASTDEDDEDASDRLASGLAEEARADLGLKVNAGDADGRTPEQLERIEQTLKNIEQSVAAQLRNPTTRSGRAQIVDQLVRRLQKLTPEARSLLSMIAASRHLDRKVYQKLSRSPGLAESTRELRKEGLLVPLSGVGDDGTRVPVYWLPPRLSNAALAASLLLPEPDREVTEHVLQELKKSGYRLDEDRDAD